MVIKCKLIVFFEVSIIDSDYRSVTVIPLLGKYVACINCTWLQGEEWV